MNRYLSNKAVVEDKDLENVGLLMFLLNALFNVNTIVIILWIFCHLYSLSCWSWI